MKTWEVNFRYDHGNGWALINAQRPSQIQSILNTQSQFKDAVVISYKEKCYHPCDNQIVNEGAVTTLGTTFYDLAVASGFVGTFEQLLSTLQGFSEEEQEAIIFIKEHKDDIINLNSNVEKLIKPIQESINNLESLVSGINTDDILDEDVQVLGVNVGNITSGSVIHEGTKVWDFLKNMLRKTIDVQAVPPTIEITTTSTSLTYEVGTSIIPKFGYNTTPGSFIGKTGYDYEQNAGCTWSNIKFFKGSTEFENSASYNFSVAEGENKFHVTGDYTASTNTPIKNDGNESEVKITAKTEQSSKDLIYQGYYKWFIGYLDKASSTNITSSQVRALQNNGNITPNKTTTLSKVYYNYNTEETEENKKGSSFVLAIPAKYSITRIGNGFDVDILSDFSDRGTVSVVTGNTNTEYKVYILPVSEGQQVEIKNIIIS